MEEVRTRRQSRRRMRGSKSRSRDLVRGDSEAPGGPGLRLSPSTLAARDPYASPSFIISSACMFLTSPLNTGCRLRLVRRQSTRILLSTQNSPSGTGYELQRKALIVVSGYESRFFYEYRCSRISHTDDARECIRFPEVPYVIPGPRHRSRKELTLRSEDNSEQA